MSSRKILAITRAVSPSFAECALTHLERTPLDVDKAVLEHSAYERLLAELGATVESLPADPALPDCVFIEDTAVVTDEFALVTRPGAESRRKEVGPVAVVLGSYRAVEFMEGPGTLDGGDVLRVGKTLFVGLGSRTNAEGVRQLTEVAGRFGYGVRPVGVENCLHLKTAVTEVADGVLLCNPKWVPTALFSEFELITVAPSEPFAANALRLGDTLVHAASHELTRQKLLQRGLNVRSLGISELAKAEAGVTCCSLLLTVP